jgi:ribosomal protein S20
VEPQVQSEIEKAEAEKRATLLQDAQTALSEARNALAALDRGDSQAALAALSRASGKLDLVVTRDPHLALAPVGVDTVVYDLYATPDTVRTIVKQARGELSDDRIQQARHELQYLASEADLQVAELPLASYPAAIKAAAPLIDQGRVPEAKAALEAALNSLVVETFVIPLPKVRAEALLDQAQQITSKPDHSQTDEQRARALIAAARNEVQFAETLGYGSKADYKPLYAEMDELQKASEGGRAQPAVFDRLRQSIERFKFSS